MDVYNMVTKCRSCLGSEKNMVSLYQVNNAQRIYESLMMLTSIRIIEKDGGPTKICNNCLQQLNEALKFKSMCEDTDKKIHDLLIESDMMMPNNAGENKYFDSEDIKVENEQEYSMTDAFTEFDDCIADDLKIEITDKKDCTQTVLSRKKKYKKLLKKNKKKLKREYAEKVDTSLVAVKPRGRGRPPKTLSDDSCVNNSRMCCSVCNKSFKSLKSQEKHMSSHSKTREYTCDKCGKQFKYRDNLKAHAMTHSGEKPFKCDMCSKTFSKKDNLQIHIRRHLKLREWSCEVCGSSYYTSYELKTHTRTHTGEKPHVCTLCGKRFTAKNNLYIHLRTHTGEKPHVCAVCGKKFTSKNILNIHSRTHTGEKPYICSVCGKRFTANKLAAHMRTHTGEKPHVCSLCGKQFSAANVLMIHMRRHTGEKPYECKICGQNYGHTQSLNKHMRKQHKIITNVRQLKMKQINEAHQAFLKSKESLQNSSKDGEMSSLQTHQIVIPKPSILHNASAITDLIQDNALNVTSLHHDV